MTCNNNAKEYLPAGGYLTYTLVDTRVGNIHIASLADARVGNIHIASLADTRVGNIHIASLADARVGNIHIASNPGIPSWVLSHSFGEKPVARQNLAWKALGV